MAARNPGGEDRPSPRVCPFTAEWFFGVGFLILTSSYFRLLSIAQGDLNKILYSTLQVARQKHMPWEVYLRSVFVQRNCQRSFKKKTVNEAACNDFRWVCKCKYKSYCENFKCRVSTENLHYVFDTGDHPTAVKCLRIAAGKFQGNIRFQVKVRFNLSNGRPAERPSSVNLYSLIGRCCWVAKSLTRSQSGWRRKALRNKTLPDKFKSFQSLSAGTRTSLLAKRDSDASICSRSKTFLQNVTRISNVNAPNISQSYFCVVRATHNSNSWA